MVSKETKMKISKINVQRFKAAAIFLLPILVLISSSVFFYSGQSPEGRTNNGTLIDPPIGLKSLNILVEDGPLIKEVPGKWIILHFVNDECTQTCWDSLYKARQVVVRLSKEGNRVARYLVIKKGTILTKKNLSRLVNEYPKVFLGHINSNGLPSILNNKKGEGLYILFDPLGNGFMIYGPNTSGGELLEDIKKLLRNSKIG